MKARPPGKETEESGGGAGGQGAGWDLAGMQGALRGPPPAAKRGGSF